MFERFQASQTDQYPNTLTPTNHREQSAAKYFFHIAVFTVKLVVAECFHKRSIVEMEYRLKTFALSIVSRLYKARWKN